MHHDATFLLRQRIPYILSHLPLIHRISAYRRPVISCDCAVGSVGMSVLSDLPFGILLHTGTVEQGTIAGMDPSYYLNLALNQFLCRFFRYLDGNYIGFIMRISF